MNIGDMALSGLAGGTQGVAQGIQTGVNAAVGIQNLQNSQQEMAIRGAAFEKYKKEEEERTKPVYKEQIMGKVPDVLKNWYGQQIAPLWEKNADNKEFIQQGKIKDFNKELMTGYTGRYMMGSAALEEIGKRTGAIKQRQDALQQEYMPILQQYHREIKEAEEQKDFKKAKNLKDELNKNVYEPKGKYYNVYQEALKLNSESKSLEDQRVMYSSGINKMNDHAEKMEQMGISPDLYNKFSMGDPNAIDEVNRILMQKSQLKADTEKEKITSREKINREKINAAAKRMGTKVRNIFIDKDTGEKVVVMQNNAWVDMEGNLLKKGDVGDIKVPSSKDDLPKLQPIPTEGGGEKEEPIWLKYKK